MENIIALRGIVSQNDLAARYGVTPSMISRIHRGVAWRDLKLGRWAVSSRKLTDGDAAIIKALLVVEWLHSDIASLFQCNIGRISEIRTGLKFADVAAADLSEPAVIAAIQQIQTAWLLRIGGLLNETMKVAA